MSVSVVPPRMDANGRVEEGDILDKGHRSNSIGTKILRVIWDNDDKTVEERKFVHKLDSVMMTIAMLSYFVKYFSQANISNAYATGMDEDLNFTGDQYNILLTMFTVGTVIGTFPGTLMMVWFRPSIWLPCCEVIWTILCMCCAAAPNPETLYGLRFFIGLLEATAYPGMVWVLGSWYGPSELGKRVIMFQATSSVGTMFSGYIQAAVHAGLDGTGGLLGWQWLMIMDGVICMPICIAGFFFIPDVPSNINPRLKWYFKEKDVAMAQARTQRWKRAPTKSLNLQSIKSIYSTWIPWVFFIPYTAFVIGLGSYLYMNLWLRATDEFNTATLINVIPTGGYAISIFMSLVYSWTSDAMGMRWPILLVGGLPPLIGNVILSVWPSATSAKFAGFFLNFTATPIGAILMAWANEILSESAESRAIVTGSMNTIAYTFNAFAPNLIWPASEAPVYSAGYKVGIGLFSVWIVGIFIIMYLQRYHPVTKYKEAYEDDRTHIRGNVEQYDEDVKRDSSDGVAVPPAVPVVAAIDGTATRQ